MVFRKKRNWWNLKNYMKFTKTTNMRALKIYSIICTLAILVLSVSYYRTNKAYSKSEKENIKMKKELKETEEALQQCSDRCYKEIG